MKEILEKITSYHIFNYLLPGVLFSILLRDLTSYSFIQEDLVIGAFVYYFVGLVVSRFGSLLVEPAFKKMGFLKFAEYKDFISASKGDSKIEILSETNNMYRTFVAMFILLLLLVIYESIALKFLISEEINFLLLILVLLVMFTYAYRKQTIYITRRIRENIG